MNTKELKACIVPTCGSKDVRLFQMCDDVGNDIEWTIRCEDCCAEVTREYRSDVIAAWNTRTPVAGLTEGDVEVAELKDAIHWMRHKDRGGIVEAGFIDWAHRVADLSEALLAALFKKGKQ